MINDMKTIILVVGTIILMSCSTINRLESSHYHYYNDTKALIVVAKKGINLTVTSPIGICWYNVQDYNNLFQPKDTIDLRYGQNKWVFENTTKFLNRTKK
jgi:hypothetical protein